MQKPDRSTYTPSDFLQWRDSESLELTPKFQRRSIWKTPAKAFLIDTLLKEMPVPPLYLRITQNAARKKIVREVVDGQQRIKAVLEFIDGKYALSPTLDAPHAGKRFDELSTEEQDRITGYPFNSEVFKGISDEEVLEVFARLNTYSVPLNAQELRNGRYFGYFKQTCYTLAHEHIGFWRENRIFSEDKIARMLEVELTSELLIAQLVGMQDKKGTIDDFYEKYDEEFKHRDIVSRNFRRTLDAISEALRDELPHSEFHRVPLFYTLFCVMYHRLFGLPKQSARHTSRLFPNADRDSLRQAIEALSEKVAAARAEEEVPESYSRFVTACLRQTDNIGPRQVRFDFLYKRAF
jgi:hypothetical protein